MLTIGRFANERTPSSMSHLYKADLHLDFAHRVVTLFWVDLTLERLDS